MKQADKTNAECNQVADCFDQLNEITNRTTTPTTLIQIEASIKTLQNFVDANKKRFP